MISKNTRRRGRPRSSGRLRVGACGNIVVPRESPGRPLSVWERLFWKPRRPEVTIFGRWPGGPEIALRLSALYTSQHFGGFRRWFACPNCGRRVGKLYSPSQSLPFACRRCWRLVYASQYQNPKSRALSRYLKLCGLLK